MVLLKNVKSRGSGLIDINLPLLVDKHTRKEDVKGAQDVVEV